MTLYKNQFNEDQDFERGTVPTKYLIIASTARSGSHMLGHALFNTGCFGNPLEYVNPKNLVEWKKITNTKTLPEVIEKLKQKRTSKNGVFSIKLHYSHLQQFESFENLQKYFPEARFILLSRKSILKQAVSFSLASQSGDWISGQTTRKISPTYNPRLINKILKRTLLENASWRYKLTSTGANFIELNFEDICVDLPGSIRSIAQFMGVDLNDQDIPTNATTRKQSSELNKEWEEKFIAENRADEELCSDLTKMYESTNKIIRTIKKTYRAIR